MRGGKLAVIENGVSASQLHNRQALALGAQHQRRQVNVMFGIQIGAVEGIMRKAEQLFRTDIGTDPDRNGVVRAAQCIIHQHGGTIAACTAIVGGPVAPHIIAGLVGCIILVSRKAKLQAAVGIQHLMVALEVIRRIRHGRRIVDDLAVHCQAISSNGFHGGTSLVGQRGAVGAAVYFLFAQAANQGNDLAAVAILHADGRHSRLGAHAFIEDQVAVVILAGFQGGVFLIGIDRHIIVREHRRAVRVQRQAALVIGNLAVRRDTGRNLFLVPQGREELAVAGVLVQHDLLHGRLCFLVQGRVDAQAIGEDLILCFGTGAAFLLHDCLGDIRKQSVVKIRVAGSTGDLFGGRFALGQGDGFRLCSSALFISNIPLVAHQSQNMVAALEQIFRVGSRVKALGILGDGSQLGAFGQAQFLHALAKILLRAGFHAIDGAGQRDGIEVSFQDGFLAVAVAKAQRAENLAHLTQNVLFTITGQVFDQLLLQRGSALLGAKQRVSGKFVQGSGNGALDVDAGLAAKILILNGDDRVLQVFRHGRNIAPDAVIFASKGVHLVAVAVIHNGGLFELLLIQVQLAVRVLGHLHHIQRKQHRTGAGRHDANAQQAANEPHDGAEYTAARLIFFLFSVFLLGGSCGCFRAFCTLHGNVPFLFGVYGDRLLWDNCGRREACLRLH